MNLNYYGHENIHDGFTILPEDAVNSSIFDNLIFHEHENYMNFHGHEKSRKPRNSVFLSFMKMNMSGQNRQNTLIKGESKIDLIREYLKTWGESV